jgi:hypothetical protein
MGTDKEDTDPSSPSALRPNSQPGGAAAVAHALPDSPSAQPTTDPGLGPASAPPPASARRPMAVTVPAPSVRPRSGPTAITPPEMTPIAAPVPATPSLTKDSVELLLEGMAGPRPDRRKTMPQSDGEASASYHAEHGVPRARTSEPAGPKVVVERPSLSAISRERPASPGPAKPTAGSREALSTFVPARVLRRRVAMAILAGVLFVLLSFMALRLRGRREALAPVAGAEATVSPESPSAQAAPPPSVESPAPVVAAQANVAPVEPVAPIAVPPVAEAVHSADGRPATPARAQGGGATTRHRRTQGEAAPAASAPGDLGEFKSKF